MVEVDLLTLKRLIQEEKRRRVLKSEISVKKKVNILAKVEDKIPRLFIR